MRHDERSHEESHARPHQEHAEHIIGVHVYRNTFLVLVLLMALTVGSSYIQFSSSVWNNAINLTIAVIKATLVVSFFMGVMYTTHLAKMFALAGFVWLLLMSIIFGDFMTRRWEPVQGWYAQDQGSEVAPATAYRNTIGIQKGTRTEVQNSGGTPEDTKSEKP